MLPALPPTWAPDAATLKVPEANNRGHRSGPAAAAGAHPACPATGHGRPLCSTDDRSSCHVPPARDAGHSSCPPGPTPRAGGPFIFKVHQLHCNAPILESHGGKRSFYKDNLKLVLSCGCLVPCTAVPKVSLLWILLISRVTHINTAPPMQSMGRNTPLFRQNLVKEQTTQKKEAPPHQSGRGQPGWANRKSLRSALRPSW